MAGEVGGVELGAAVTVVPSPGVGGLFSTSADMVLGGVSLDKWTVGGIKQAAAPQFGVSKVKWADDS